MLKISKLADYATVVMAFMAKQQHVIYTANDIADRTHIPLPTVSKVLKLLAQANLLTSHRGARGGYSLELLTAKISVAKIIAAIDGELALTECSHSEGACELQSQCEIADNWQMINKTVKESLAKLSLADLIGSRQE